ncbi:alcohol dehydrogenase catalytic domain-containing protein [Streptomyces sp. NPDC059866]|uniref:alcohol dehydrogenase catalytic domain-containing protein n=1 Tax=Streptomyces sp. NPDC059866 TaxID=3346978 RepID=UPI00364D5CEF
MHARRFTASEGSAWREAPDPHTADQQVVVDVTAAGLCHTDVSHIRSGGAHLPFTPMTLGHEICGTISAPGPRAESGELAGPAGPGSGRDGGYAERVLAFADELVTVPDGVDDLAAAVATEPG